MIDKARISLPFLESCTPGYYNNEGQPEKRAAQNSTYGGGSIEYFQILADWRGDGALSRAGSDVSWLDTLDDLTTIRATEADEGIALVTLDRPERLNAITTDDDR